MTEKTVLHWEPPDERVRLGFRVVGRERTQGGAMEQGPRITNDVEVAPGLRLQRREEQREVFHWNDGLGTGVGHDFVFDVTSLRKHIRAGKLPHTIIEMPVNEEGYKYTVEQRGVEDWRVKEFEPIDLVEPVIAILMLRKDIMEWQALNIDGAHRFARRFLEGIPYIQAYLVEPPHFFPYMAAEGRQAVFFERFPPEFGSGLPA